MTRLSSDQYEERGGQSHLINGYDYVNQAWVLNGQYVDCGHPEDMDCGCYGRLFQGTDPEPGLLDGSEL